MTKRTFTNRFGLAVLLLLSLFASTAAFASSGPQNVVVTNTPAQPVPMVGLIKDTDASARKPFQWEGTFTQSPHLSSAFKIVSVPASQRLVIEQVTGMCAGSGLLSLQESGPPQHYQWLSASYSASAGTPVSTPVRFYADPGADFSLYMSNGYDQDFSCSMTLTGYFVDLP